MERSAFPDFDAERGPASPAARRLATLVAQRLDAVVPRPFRVEAEGGVVSLHEGATWDTSIHVASLVDQDVDRDAAPGERGSFAWNAASAAESVLNNVQDGVAEGTKDPWPRLADGTMAMWGTRTDGTRIWMWYGPYSDRETDAVLSFEPISIEELGAPE